MTLDPLSASSSSSWSLDPSLIGIRQKGGTELLSLWEKQSLMAPSQSPRQGRSPYSTSPSHLSPVLMSLLDSSPQFRFYPLSPFYNFRFASFGFLSQSSLPLTTSSTPLFTPPPNQPGNPSISLQRIYFSISAILEDTLERINQIISSDS
jgi:hypothetical protein